MITYEQSVRYLYEKLPMYQRVGKTAFKKDLNNTHALLEHLGNPHDSFKTVHVAGTNGKGSSCQMLSSVLQAAGYQVGLYTSPHLKHFTERISINGAEINRESVIAFVDMMKPVVQKINPSFFETTVAMAFWFFAKKKVDIAVVETGLGGRLDSTNVITPQVSLITNIGYDHMDILGQTLPEIAAEKAGIIKKGVPVVIGSHQPEVFTVFEEKARTEQAPMSTNSSEYEIRDVQKNVFNRVVDIYYRQQLIYREMMINNGADYLLKNVPGVLDTLNVLVDKGFDVPENAVRDGFAALLMKGRVQVINQKPLMIADVSHNAPGIVQLLNQLSGWDYGKLRFVIGFVRDKDVADVLKAFPSSGDFYFTQSHVPRTLSAEELSHISATVGLKGRVFENVNDAIETAKNDSRENDITLICGSTFVVAEINGL